jgi:hypothetical protein
MNMNKELFDKIHKIACQKGESTYIDPSSGYPRFFDRSQYISDIDNISRYTVFTEIYHKKRGKCCGNACRHCPYGHQNVPKPHSCSTCNPLDKET